MNAGQGDVLRVYVENVPGRDPAYAMPEERVRKALAGSSGPIVVAVHAKDDPDLVALREADIFVGSGFDPMMVGEHGNNLRVVHCTSAGIERYLPLDWLPQGAVLTNSSGVHAEKAGEYGLLALLMLNDRVPKYAADQRMRAWAPQLSTPIRGKTVLICGVGAVGGAVAEKAKLLGLRVTGTRRAGERHPLVDRMERAERLGDLLPEADFLVVSCPLTTETRSLIGSDQIAQLPRGAGVVNMSRAAVVDYAAVAAALRGGHLGGAVLDVFAPEPLPGDSELWDVPNLIITPHTSSDSPIGYIERSLAILADNMARLRAGTTLLNRVDPELGY